jgi:tetratricopeptide (TPR) repeat protein
MKIPTGYKGNLLTMSLAGVLVISSSAISLASKIEDCAQTSASAVAVKACTGLIDAGGQSATDLAKIFNYRGLAYAAQNMNTRAFLDFNQALSLNTKLSEVYLNRANLYLDMKQFKPAIQDFSQVLEIDPSNGPAYLGRGIALGETGAFEPSIRDLTKALEIVPDNHESYFNRGLSYGRLGKTELSIKDFDRAIELNPKDARAYSERGISYFELGQSVTAIQDFSKALQLAPKDPTSYLYRGHILLGMEQTVRAIDDLTQAMRLDASNPAVSNELSYAYLKANQIDNALLVAEYAVTLSPNDGGIWDTQGDVFCRAGRNKEAIEAYAKSRRLAPRLAIVKQEIMQASGHYMGDISGVFGPDSDKALAEWVKDKCPGF